MWINTSTLTPLDRATINPPPTVKRVLPSLAVGTVLKVLVAGEAKSGAYQLLANGERLSATSQQKLDVGGTYQLQVTGFDKSGQLVMRVMPETPTLIQSALEQRLSFQLEPARLLQVLFSLVQTGSPIAQHPELANLLSAFAQRRDISSGNRLSERIKNSGLFFEHLLQLSSDRPRSDLKGALLMLREWLATQIRKNSASGNATLSIMSEEGDADSLNLRGATASSAHSPLSKPPSPLPAGSTAYANTQNADKRPFSFVSNASAAAEALDLTTIQGLKRAVDGAISRIEAQQLLSLQAQHQQQIFLLFEIPVVVREQLSTWHFNIREELDENGDDESQAKSWSVVLAVDLPAVGPLSILLTHSKEATSVTFYSERRPVCGLIDAAIPEFERRLEKLGLSGLSLSSQLGKLPASEEPNIEYPKVHATA